MLRKQFNWMGSISNHMNLSFQVVLPQTCSRVSNYYQWLGQSLIGPVEQTAGVSSRTHKLRPVSLSHFLVLDNLLVLFWSTSCSVETLVYCPPQPCLRCFCFNFVFVQRKQWVAQLVAVCWCQFQSTLHRSLFPVSHVGKINTFSFKWKNKNIFVLGLI